MTTDRAGVADALDRFFFLHQARAELAGTIAHRNVFDASMARRFLTDVCERFADRGALRIFALKVGDKTAAMRIGFALGDSLYLYYSGFDPDFGKYSVMTTVVAEAIQYAIEEGFATVNLSTGNDVSKTRWNPTEVRVPSGVDRVPVPPRGAHPSGLSPCPKGRGEWRRCAASRLGFSHAARTEARAKRHAARPEESPSGARDPRSGKVPEEVPRGYASLRDRPPRRAMSFAPNEPEQTDDTEGSIGVSPGEWIRFVLAAARRHLLLGTASLVVVASIGVAISIAIPSMYEASSKILVSQTALATAALSNPNRQLPVVDPMRGITEVTMTRENLESIIRETGLIQHWAVTRSPILKAKDWLWSVVMGPIPDSDRVRALIGVLETRINLRAEDSTTIRIQVVWGDREMVVKLAKAVHDKFLQARVAQETSVITAAIGVIEDELKRAGEAIEPALGGVVRAREKSKEAKVAASPDARRRRRAPTTAPPATFVRTAPKPQRPDPAVSTKLAEIRQAERNVLEPWQRRLTELRLQLADLRSQYGAAHPLVVQQEARIKDATIEPAELGALREEERMLILTYRERADGAGRWDGRPLGALANGGNHRRRFDCGGSRASGRGSRGVGGAGQADERGEQIRRAQESDGRGTHRAHHHRDRLQISLRGRGRARAPPKPHQAQSSGPHLGQRGGGDLGRTLGRGHSRAHVRSRRRALASEADRPAAARRRQPLRSTGALKRCCGLSFATPSR